MADAVLVVIAHPDDESRLCGGIIAHLAQQGVSVHLLCLTRGEGGELGDPPLATRETLGQVREQEMVCAAQALGVRSLTFMDYVDPPVGPENSLQAPTNDPIMLAGQIANAMQQFQVAAVLSHGSSGEYGHPAHVLLYQMTLAAVLSLGDAAPVFYSFAAHFESHPYPRLTNANDSSHFVVDVSDYVAGPMLKAALCHKTQHALFVRRYSEELGRPASVAEVVARVSQEGLRRHWPAVAANTLPDDVFARWVAQGDMQR